MATLTSSDIRTCPVCGEQQPTKRIACGWDVNTPFWVMECESCGCTYKLLFEYSIHSREVLEVKNYKKKQIFRGKEEEVQIQYESEERLLHGQVLGDDEDE